MLRIILTANVWIIGKTLFCKSGNLLINLRCKQLGLLRYLSLWTSLVTKEPTGAV